MAESGQYGAGEAKTYDAAQVGCFEELMTLLKSTNPEMTGKLFHAWTGEGVLHPETTNQEFVLTTVLDPGNTNSFEVAYLSPSGRQLHATTWSYEDLDTGQKIVRVSQIDTVFSQSAPDIRTGLHWSKKSKKTLRSKDDPTREHQFSDPATDTDMNALRGYIEAVGYMTPVNPIGRLAMRFGAHSRAAA